jgi:hypothetical protein
VSGSLNVDLHSAESELQTLGVRCAIEARGNLAVVIPVPGERALEDVNVRRGVVAALLAHGFTHVAVEASDVDRPEATADATRA